MKRVLIAAFAILTLAAGAGAGAADKPKASDKPNYSGEWKMNPAASNFGQFPPPNSFVRKIQHTDPALKIVEDQAAGGADSTTARKLTTDGQPLRSNSMDSPRCARRSGMARTSLRQRIWKARV
jgi:hypothetical protein